MKATKNKESSVPSLSSLGKDLDLSASYKRFFISFYLKGSPRHLMKQTTDSHDCF